jgi:SNF2 family DNA or RNA helicase
LLTGSPIQNNLDELYAIVSFACPGFLGSIASFRQKFANPIQFASDPHASSSDKREAKAAAVRANVCDDMVGSFKVFKGDRALIPSAICS